MLRFRPQIGENPPQVYMQLNAEMWILLIKGDEALRMILRFGNTFEVG